MMKITKKVNNQKWSIFLFHLFSICQIGHDEQQGTTGNEQSNQQSTGSDNQPLPQRQTNQS